MPDPHCDSRVGWWPPVHCVPCIDCQPNVPIEPAVTGRLPIDSTGDCTHCIARTMTAGVDRDTEELLSLLDDEYARTIILETYGEAQSVDALSTACNADPSTVYRRIDRLQEHDLLQDQQRLDPGGHHYKVYVARLEGVSIDVTDDGFDIEVDYTEEAAADTFTRLYEEFSG